MEKKIILSICIIIIMLVSAGISVNAIKIKEKQPNIVNNYRLLSNIEDSYTNLTVQETWELLNDTSNGIQILIDVRLSDEWRDERIDTPFPEHPRLYPLDLLENETILPKFLLQYHECSVILFCSSGSRSYQAVKILIVNNFTGTIYNLPGGMDEWKSEGFPTGLGEIYSITVDEAWDLLTNTENGIQIPIDVRTKEEWNAGFIDTPWPENPIWYTLDLLKNDITRKEFMADNIGQEIMLYCNSGARSLTGSYELYYDNFTGTQYNMLGGITEWEKYHPVRGQTEPNMPVIEGPAQVRVETVTEYTFTSIDPEDDVVWYWINWGDGCPSVEWIGPYASGESTIVSHSYAEKGTYNITAKAKDFYGNESALGSFDVQVPKAFNFNFNILEWVFERFPNVFPILRYLMEL